jgi:hypothetical protein
MGRRGNPAEPWGSPPHRTSIPPHRSDIKTGNNTHFVKSFPGAGLMLRNCIRMLKIDFRKDRKRFCPADLFHLNTVSSL